MMREAILKFPKQFEWQPKIENIEALHPAEKFLVFGMGGSHLSADLLKTAMPSLDLAVHSDYGLPLTMPKSHWQERLLIFSSYSGQTEEVLDSLKEALIKGRKVAVMAVGGELIKQAQEYRLPFVQMPDWGLPPRLALGLSLRGIMKLMGQEAELKNLGSLATLLKPESLEKEGEELVKNLKNRVPVIYASSANQPLAYNWKIKFNETGKIPAFYNVLPELNHNEMTGFDVRPSTRSLSEIFSFIFLQDPEDDPRLQKRWQVLAKFYQGRKLPVTTLGLQGQNKWHQIFSSLVLADWTAYYTAEQYGLDPDAIPMVEEFKKLMKDSF